MTEKSEASELKAAKKPKKNLEKAKKIGPKQEQSKTEKARTVEDTEPKAREVWKEAEDPFICVKEYGSVVEIAEKVYREIVAAKSALGRYLRRLDDKRALAEKSKRLYDLVAKLSNKKKAKENPNKIEVNGLEIVLDATPLNEVTTLESVVKSHQKRLQVLHKAQVAIETLNQAGDTEGIRYLVLEREGIPEQILLKLM